MPPPNKTENLQGTNLFKRSLSSDDERRHINLVLGKTLGTLRRESKLEISLLEKFRLSSLDSNDDDDTDTNELILGEKLGQGGFSSVYVIDETTAIKILSTSTIKAKENNSNDEEQKQKHLRHLEIASTDIVREAYFLNRLSHENIISFKGEGSLEDIASYYIFIERIYIGMKETVRSVFQPKLATLENGHLGQRLEYGIQIADAMQYLHSRKIIYRDLKLDNLGLNQNDQVLLYDFGLAKELKGQAGEGGKYNLTGNTGSWVYMAPEVAKNFRYNLSADVFSYAMLLWELCNGQEIITLIHSQYEIVHRNERPSLTRSFPQDLEDLIRECWSWNPNSRPTFEEIQKRLDPLAQEAASKQTVLEVIGEMSGVMMGGLFRGSSTESTSSNGVRSRLRALSPKRGGRASSPMRNNGKGGGPAKTIKARLSPLRQRRGESPKRPRGMSPKRKG